MESEAYFRELYEQNVDYVWSALSRFGIKPMQVEDATHDVFVVAWRKLAEYDPSRPIRPWLCGIAFRVASDLRDRACERRECAGPLDAQDDQPQPDALLEQQQAQQVVRSAVAEIPSPRQAVFVLHELKGRTIPEIAALLGVPLNTAYSRLRLARRDFAKALQPALFA